MFTKELLAKYVNTYSEVYHGKKLVIGPHFVVRGSQKNYAQFLNYNFDNKPDNIYFEDAVALAILFKTAEKLYGIKPNAIGDMRYITVPYAIAWLGYKLNYQLDLYRIWKTQELSSVLNDKLYEIMVKIEDFIKSNAPGSLYGEWAKKEECWITIKENDLDISLGLNLPEGVSVVGEQTEVLVRVGIAAIESSLMLPNVTVEITGLSPGFRAVISPETVMVILSGPVALLDRLEITDVRVVVDLTDLGVGTYQLEPEVEYLLTDLAVESILPESVEITIMRGGTSSP